MHTQIAARQLAAWLDDTLQIARWKDYCQYRAEFPRNCRSKIPHPVWTVISR
jgi:hypothetical protein